MVGAASSRLPWLNRLLELAQVQPGAGIRVLEIDTERHGGASAAALAARGACVVSLSAATRETGAARSACGQTARLAFHSGPLASGWPADGPYDLVLSYHILDRIPHAWIVQCAPGGHVLSPVWLRLRDRSTMAILWLTLDRQGLLTWPPMTAPVEQVEQPTPEDWSLRPAVPDSDQDGYGFRCGCPECMAPVELRALAEPVGTDGQWVRPIDPGAPAHLAAVSYRTIGLAWLALCGIAFNPAGAASRQHRRCPACVLLQATPQPKAEASS